MQLQLIFHSQNASGSLVVESGSEVSRSPGGHAGDPRIANSDVTRPSLYIPWSEGALKVSEIPTLIDFYNGRVGSNTLSREPDAYKLYWYTVLCELSTNVGVFAPEKTCAIISNVGGVLDKAVIVMTRLMNEASEKRRDYSSEVDERIQSFKQELEEIVTRIPIEKWEQVAPGIDRILYKEWLDFVESFKEEAETYERLYSDWAETENEVIEKLSAAGRYRFAKKRLGLLGRQLASSSFGNLKNLREQISAVEVYDNKELIETKQRLLKEIEKLRKDISAKAYTVFEDVEDLVGIGSNQDKLQQGLARLDGMKVDGIEELAAETRDEMRVGIKKMIDEYSTKSVGDWNGIFRALILQLNAEGEKSKILKIRKEWQEFIAALPESAESQKLYDEVLDEITKPMFESDLKRFEDMEDLSNVDIDEIEFMGLPESLKDRKQALIKRNRAKNMAELKRLGKNLAVEQPDLEQVRQAVSAIDDLHDSQLIGMKRKLLRKINRLVEGKVLDHGFAVFEDVNALIGFGSNLEKLRKGSEMLDPVDVDDYPDLIRVRDRLRGKISNMITVHRTRTLEKWNEYFRGLCLKESSSFESYKAQTEWKEFIDNLKSKDDQDLSLELYHKTIDEITRPMFIADLEKFEQKPPPYSESDLQAVEDMIVPDDLNDRREALIRKMKLALGDRGDSTKSLEVDDEEQTSLDEEEKSSDPDVAEFRRALDRAVSLGDEDDSESSSEAVRDYVGEFRREADVRRESYLKRIRDAAKRHVRPAPVFRDDDSEEEQELEQDDVVVGSEDESSDDEEQNFDELSHVSTAGDLHDELPHDVDMSASVGHDESEVGSEEGPDVVVSTMPVSSHHERHPLPTTIRELNVLKEKIMKQKNTLQRQNFEESNKSEKANRVVLIRQLQVQIKDIDAEIKRMEKGGGGGKLSKVTTVVPKTAVGRSALSSSSGGAGRHLVPKVFTEMSFEELITAIKQREQSIHKLDEDMRSIRASIGIQRETLKRFPENSGGGGSKRREDKKVLEEKAAAKLKIRTPIDGFERQIRTKLSLRKEKESELVEIRSVLGESKLEEIETLLKGSTDDRLISIVDLGRIWNTFLTNGSLHVGQEIAGRRNFLKGLIRLIKMNTNTKFDEFTLLGEICNWFKANASKHDLSGDPRFTDCHYRL